MASRSSVFTTIIAIEALLLLAPATFLYLGGMFILLAGFFQANKGGVTPVFLIIAGILLVPGYGLFSLWWLVFKFRKISLSTVPFFIYGGLAAGALTGLLFISPFLRGGFGPPTPYITMYDNSKSFIMIGGGPLIVLITLILLLWLKKGIKNGTE